MRILYLEDSVTDADLAKRALARVAPGDTVEVVTTIAAARERLRKAADFDLVLADLGLPDGNGLEILEHVRGGGLPLAVVILTGSGDQEAAVAALKAGADDYLTKHADYFDRLPRTLTAALAHFRSAAHRMRSLRVLYVEHNAFDIDLTQRHFARHAPHLHLHVVGRASEALRLLPPSVAETPAFDVLLLDYRLAPFDALELTKMLRLERGLDLPIVLVTGQGSEEVAAQAMHLGVTDYLTKHDNYLFELPATLEKAYHQVELARERVALEVAKQRYDELAARIPAGVTRLCMTRDGGQYFDYLSPRLCEILGVDMEAALADAGVVFGVVHPDDRPGLLQSMAASRHDLKPWSWEGRFLKNGTVRWLRVEALATPRDNGDIWWDGMQVDITERKLAEAQLRLQGAALEASANAIVITDTNAVVQWANPAFMILTGYRREDIVGKNPKDILRSGLQSREFYEVMWRTILAGGVWRGELVNRRKNGSLYQEAMTITPVPDEHGVVHHFIAVKEDITERKRAEDKLRQSATVFESTRDGVMITDTAPAILAVNRAFSEVTGYTEQEALGHNPSLLKSERHDAFFYQAMWASLLEAGAWQGEIWNRRKNGETYPEWLSISAVHDDQGEVTRYVGVFTDMSQLKRTEESLAHLTHFDPLTGLPNRLLFQSRLEHALDGAARYGRGMAVLLIDLDRFKEVNDSLGHPTGDQLLRAVAGRLQEQVARVDTIARIGGDEFALLLEHLADPQQAAVLGRDVASTLAAPFELEHAHEVVLGASIGISLFPDDGGSATELMRNADTAMYRAKENGRGQFCFYTGDMNAEALTRLEMEAALRGAVERGELLLHYQPKVDLGSGQVCGAEALLRWQRPGRGLVPPLDFIPLAERTGLILPIGAWVIDEACRQMRAWRDDGMACIPISVNVSARQFFAGDLEHVVPRLLEKHGVEPQCLDLELTESMLMERPDEAVALLRKLKDIGVTLSLDDFGTGYSSLAYLSRFPIDTLKIDQSFVRNIVTEPISATIAVSIIALAHRMQLRVVAEGVETDTQLGYLRMHLCDEMQGFYFSKPLPTEAFSELMRAGASIAPGEEAPERTVLFVDDEENVLSALKRSLRRDGYRLLTASCGREALDVLARNPVQVVVSDQRMPEMNGVEFLGLVKELYPDTVRIVLSGYTDLESVTRMLNAGAVYKFLTKPWDDEELRHNIRDAFLYHEAVIKPRNG
jgi:diguanylate cyclase (GGDEF)-like protein/PAS domain S-box-containing protein